MTETSQRKKFFHFFVSLSWLVSLIFGPLSDLALAREAIGQPANNFIGVPPGRALQDPLAIDSDFDGIPDAVEQAGWYNGAGVLYQTDPNDPDSDNDGLQDGKEQLYDTNPLDPQSPGILVEYQNNFYTKKYWPWQQHGDKYIVHGQLSSSNRDVIIRRGTTFLVGGPPNATLTIQKSISGLTDLVPVKNTCGGGWTVSVPLNGTVGKYTLKLQDGTWSQTMTLYVIFDIPADLSSSEVSAYLYSDDLAESRDQHAAWIDTSYDFNESSSPTNPYYGWGYAFPTDQYKSYLFEGYIINAINGKSSRSDAFSALAHKVDSVTRFDANVPNYSMYTSLNSLEQRNHCSGIATVAVGFLRSAGIPSRAIVTDWKTRHYDTSTEAWIGTADGRGDKWRVVRAWNDSQEADSSDTSPYSQTVTGGIYGPNTRYYHGHNKYTDGNSAIISTLGPNWNWSEIRKDMPCGSGGSKRIYDKWFLPEMGRESPAKTPGSISNVAGWLSQTKPYWGWPSEPSTDQLLSYPCKPAVGGTSLTSQEVPFSPVQSAALFMANVPATQSQIAHFSRVVRDYGVDTNGNGRYDKLVVEVEVEVNQPGNYTVIGRLNDSTPTPLTVNGDMATASRYLFLNAGKQIVPLEFNGESIYKNGEDGAYTLSELWLSSLKYPEDVDLENNAVDYQQPGYQTGVYQRENFENGGARLSRSYSYDPIDLDGNGYYDRLVVKTGLNINTAGEYRVEGELKDANGEVVATGSWKGSGGQVELVFEGLLSDTRPYYLDRVYLFNPGGSIIDSQASDDPTEGGSGLGIYQIGPLYNVSLSAAAVVTPTVTSATRVDTDNNGYYDRLDFGVNVTIAVAGNYRLEGWLESAEGGLISWQTSAPVALAPGVQQMSLSFPGQAINGFKANGPYQLIALKVLQGAYTVIDEVPIAFKTSAFAFADFEASQGGSGGNFIMQDEGNPNNWDMGATTWNLTNLAAWSPLYSWTDSPNGAYGSSSTTLTSKPFAINNGAAAELFFKTCYDINTDGDQGAIQVNTNGGWLTAPGTTYTGLSSGWIQKQHVLPPVIGSNDLSFRFMMTGNSSNNKDGWYVDDLFVKLNYDLDQDGISNAVEAVADDGVTLYPNTDGDSNPDYLDTDTDNDTIPDSIEGAGDPDGDGIPSFRDLDSDNDGALDSVEGTGDSDNDHIPNFLDNNNPNSDADGDTIIDSAENIPGHENADGDSSWNVADPDSDNDGISDSIEAGDANVSTPPVDTDKDGLPDFIDLDADNDGIPDSVEGTADTDGDTIPDYRDLDSDGDGMPDLWENLHHLNPVANDNSLDPDGDGLSNGVEYTRGTDPGNPDTDGDGMPDGWEVTHNTNPLVKDNTLDPDHDGLSNGQEYSHGTNPGNKDTDGDGMPDGWEVINGFDPTADDSQGDADEDGLSNEEEYIRDTNPNNPDTDGDTIPDGIDPNPGRVTYESYLPIVIKK